MVRVDPSGSSKIHPWSSPLIIQIIYSLTESNDVSSFSVNTTFLACNKDLKSLLKRQVNERLKAMQGPEDKNTKSK